MEINTQLSVFFHVPVYVNLLFVFKARGHERETGMEISLALNLPSSQSLVLTSNRSLLLVFLSMIAPWIYNVDVIVI